MKPEIEALPQEEPEVLPVSDDETQMFPATPSDGGEAFSVTPTGPEDGEVQQPPKRRRYNQGLSSGLSFLDLQALQLRCVWDCLGLFNPSIYSLKVPSPQVCQHAHKRLYGIGSGVLQGMRAGTLGTPCTSTELNNPSIQTSDYHFGHRSGASGSTSWPSSGSCM